VAVPDSKPWRDLTDREILELAIKHGFLEDMGPLDKMWLTVSKVRGKVFMAEVMNGRNGRPWGEYKKFVPAPPVEMPAEVRAWIEERKR